MKLPREMIRRVTSALEPKKHYAIRTGLYLVDEETGQRLAVMMCSSDQNSNSWIEEGPQQLTRVRCGAHCPPDRDNHEAEHEVLSLMEALSLGQLDVDDGGVLVANSSILAGVLHLARLHSRPRTAPARRKAS
jgi:hypothetical protein